MEDILKGWLIKLNWKSGSMSVEGLAPALKSATLQATFIADAIIATVGMLKQAAVKLAEFYEDMSYAAQRNRTTVLSTLAFSKTIANMGGSIDRARSTVDKFSHNLRSNDGYYSLLVGMGVKVKDSNGKFRDSVDILEDLGPVLARMRYQDQLQYADLLGIDEQTLRAITDPEFGRGVARYKQLVQAGGFDVDEASKSWVQFNNTFRDFMATLDLLFEKIETAVIKQFGGQLADLTKFLIAHSNETTDAIINAMNATIGFGRKLYLMAGGFEGFLHKIQRLIHIFALIVTFIEARLKNFWDALTVLKRKTEDFERGAEFIAQHPLAAVGMFGDMALEGLGLKDAPKPRPSQSGAPGTPVAPQGATPGAVAAPRQSSSPSKLHYQGVPTESTTPGPTPPRDSNAPTGKDSLPGGTATAEKLTLHFMNTYGLTREQAVGMVGVMSYESGNFKTLQEQAKRNDAGGYGFAQWTGPRRVAYFDWCAQKGLDPASYEANVGYLDHELSTGRYAATIDAVKKAKTVRDAAYAYEWVYEGMRPNGPGVPAFEKHMARAELLDRQLPKNLGTAPEAPAIASPQPALTPEMLRKHVEESPATDPQKVSMLTGDPIQTSDPDRHITIDRTTKIRISGETNAHSAAMQISRQQRQANMELASAAKEAMANG